MPYWYENKNLFKKYSISVTLFQSGVQLNYPQSWR
jgi:hypothetical protein